MSQPKPVNWAVIGMGFIAPRHIQAIESIGHKVLVTCDIDPDKNANFTDWVEMYNHPLFKEVDFVAICAPNYLHSIMAREALMRGKRVLCEKPLTINGDFGMDGVKAVMQLRHNPEVKELRKNKPQKMHVEARMFRDEKYWNSWKGNEVKSGGVLYNLGVHYVDLLIYVWGSYCRVLEVEKTDKMVKGTVRWSDGREATFHIEVVDSREKQGRTLIADGKEIILSNQDNLSYEDLHIEVYKDFIKGLGVSLSEARKSLGLIKEILEWKH